MERALSDHNCGAVLEVYRRWKDKGVNLEGLLLAGQWENWIPPDIAAEFIDE